MDVYTIRILTILLIISCCIIVYLAYNVMAYRNLTVKLSNTIKEMYCEHIDDNGKRCEFLKYYTTPVDDHKGMITKYCSIHLVEKTGMEG